MWSIAPLSIMHQRLLLIHLAILVVLAAHALLTFGGKRLLFLQLGLSFIQFLVLYFDQKTLKKVLLATISPKVLSVICALNFEFLWSFLELSKVLA